MSIAFQPYQLGPVTLTNRIVMAPMTRSRAYGPGNSPPTSRPSTTPSAPAPGSS